MRGMILAAGLGKRMGDLTLKTPKALLKVGHRYLIEYPIQSFVNAGIREIVINIFYHKEQIKEALGDGSNYGVNITYSEEDERLETGGGIVKALPLLGPDPFVVMSSDVITDYPLENLFKKDHRLAHLILVQNPAFHLQGDFCLNENNEIYYGQSDTFTFASFGIYRPELFTGYKPIYFCLPDAWKAGIHLKK